MHQRKIWNTSGSFSEPGFGASVIGNLYRVTPAGDATPAVDAAWDAGLRYFDTAPHYGPGLSSHPSIINVTLGMRTPDRSYGT